MNVLINVLSPIFIAASIAAVAQRYLKLDTKVLARVTFYLFSSALVFDALVNSDVSGAEFGRISAAVTLTTLVLWGIGEVAARWLRLEGPTRAAFLIAIVLMNSGNYGLPVNLFAFGEPGLMRASLYVAVSLFLRSSLCVYLAARGRTRSIRLALRRVLAVPLGYVAILGVVVNLSGWTLPAPVLKTAHLLGQGTVPTMLMVLGIQLTETFQDLQMDSHIPALIGVVVGRLILAPLIAYWVGGFVGLDALSHRVVILESATPSAVSSLVLATEFESDPSFTALSIFVTTALSLVTVTTLLNWLM
jgi:hypothetical protein